MNNFNFGRFNKVVVRDFHGTYSLFGMSMLIIMLLPLFIWMLGLAVQDDVVAVFNRRRFIQFAVVLTAAISSMKIYNSCNLKGKGNYFAMLPASLGEKFASMMLYCFIVCPLAVFVGACAVDTLLTLLPFGPYQEFLWQKPDWMVELQDITMGGPVPSFFLLILHIIMISSMFMFSNTIFKKSKFIKTVLWAILICFVGTLIVAPIAAHVNWDFDWLRVFAKWFKDMGPKQILIIFYWSRVLFAIVVTAVFSFFTYRRLKKMQY